MFPSFAYTPLKLVSIAPERIYHAEYCILNCNARADPGGECRGARPSGEKCITIIHVLVPMKLTIELYIMAITSSTHLYSEGAKRTASYVHLFIPLIIDQLPLNLIGFCRMIIKLLNLK